MEQEAFSEFWAGFGKRMLAGNEEVERIAGCAWHAAKAGGDVQMDRYAALLTQCVAAIRHQNGDCELVRDCDLLLAQPR